jgi:hypothetical protein
MKTSFIILFLFLISHFSFAQGRVTSRLPQDHNLTGDIAPVNSGVGVKGGASFTTLRGSGADGMGRMDLKTSFHAGAYAQLRVSNSFSVQPELLYSRKGYLADGTDVSPSIKLDYIDLPILAVYNLSYRWSVHAGPQLGFLVALRQNDREMDRGPYRATDVGGAIGTEFRASIARLGLRYNHGFIDVRNDVSGLKNSALQVYLGVGF